MKPGTILYCRVCGVGYGTVGEIPAQCPACGKRTQWSTMAPAPRRPYELTFNDRRMLRKMHISPDR